MNNPEEEVYMVLDRRTDGMLEGFYENAHFGETFCCVKDAIAASEELDSANLMIVKFVQFL